MWSLKRDLLLLFAALLPPIASAVNSGRVSVVPGAYIVEFADNSTDHHLNTFFTHLSEQEIPATPRLNLTHDLFNGASFHLDVADKKKQKQTVQRISAHNLVKNVYPMRRRWLPYDLDATGRGASRGHQQRKRTTYGAQATHAMTGVDKLHALGYTGKGINIAIVDSGIDYTHPALGGCFGKGCKVSYGFDLVGDDFTPMDYANADLDPFDGCIGHGTHVAGIIAAEEAEYGVTGVAPGVTLGMFRAVGCAGFTDDDVLIAAFLMASNSHADVITASLGTGGASDDDPWSLVVSRIVKSGIPCTIAAGNDGEYGLFYASSGGDGNGVTSVASVDNVESPILAVPATYTANNVTNSYTWAPGFPSNISGTYPLYAFTYDTTSTDDSCFGLPEETPDLSDYIVLIQRGGCYFYEKAYNALAHGARHVLFYNNQPGAISIEVPDDGIESAGLVTEELGKTWIALLSAGYDVILNVTNPSDTPMDLSTPKNTRTGGHPSTYTSWGPTFEGRVKPQVSAPGGSILSTYPLEMGGYAILSGTSMATPFVAGAIALIKEARGQLDPASIESLLSATARPSTFNDGQKDYKYLAPVAQQGAGLIDVHKAVHATTVLSVSSISFNDTDHFTGSASFDILNNGSTSVSYRLGYIPGASAYTIAGNDTIFDEGGLPDTTPQSAGLTFDQKIVTVPSGESVTVQVKPSLPTGLITSRIPVYGGYITLNGTNGDSFSLPYLGIASSLYQANIFGPGSANRRVYLSSLGGSDDDMTSSSTTDQQKYNPIKPGFNYTLPTPSNLLARSSENNQTLPSNITLPVIVAHLSIPSPLLRIDVQPLDSAVSNTTTTTNVLDQSTLGSISGFPQRSMPRGPMMVGWQGQLSDGSFVPAGRYQLVVSALRLFGDALRMEDYEQVKTVPFGVRYMQ